MHKEKPPLTEIIVAIKEHEAHMVITNHLPTATSGSADITGENLYFTGRQWKQGGVWKSASKAEIDWGNSKGTDSVCFRCRRPGHVAVKCIADMPQEVKDHIVSGAALVAREDELDKLADDDVTKTVAFARDNPCTFTLMANTLWPAHDHKDEWEPKFKDDKNQALSSITSNAWKQFRLMEHSWYVEDPTWSTGFRRVGVLEFGLQKVTRHLMWTYPI